MCDALAVSEEQFLCTQQCALLQNMLSRIVTMSRDNRYATLFSHSAWLHRCMLCTAMAGQACCCIHTLQNKSILMWQAGKDAQNQVQAAAARALQVGPGPCLAVHAL